MNFTLPSGIECEIRPMSGKMEKILTDRHLAKNGSNINELLRRVIVSLDGKPIDPKSASSEQTVLALRSGDRNYILLQLRILSYGEMMSFEAACPECKKKNQYTVNLQDLLDNGDLRVLPYPVESVRRVDLPSGGYAEVTYLDGYRERKLASMKDIDIIALTMAQMVSINGEAVTRGRVEDAPARDLAAIRAAAKDMNGGLMQEFLLTCGDCDNEFPVYLTKIQDFFTPLTTSSANAAQ